MYSPGKYIKGWHQAHASMSIELMESFVQSIEKHAEEFIDLYGKNKEIHFIEDEIEENHGRMIESHQGLDSETWDLSTIFGEYFPDLQRRSGLLTICAYFEYELDRLCLKCQSEKKFKLSLSDLSDKGVERSIKYLEKIVGLEVYKNSSIWLNIKKIQKIRNIIVHQDGELHDHQGCPNKPVIDYINEMQFLSGSDKVELKNGFLLYVVSVYKEYFKLIDKSIQIMEKSGS